MELSDVSDVVVTIVDTKGDTWMGVLVDATNMLVTIEHADGSGHIFPWPSIFCIEIPKGGGGERR